MSTIGTTPRGGSFAALRVFLAIVATARSWIGTGLARRRSRVALLDLTDEQLKDVGLSRRDAEREARRFFWDHGMRRAEPARQPLQAPEPPAQRLTSAAMRAPAE